MKRTGLVGVSAREAPEPRHLERCLLLFELIMHATAQDSMLQTFSISLWSPLHRRQTCFLPYLQPRAPPQLEPVFHSLHTADRAGWALAGFSFEIFSVLPGCCLSDWT